MTFRNMRHACVALLVAGLLGPTPAASQEAQEPAAYASALRDEAVQLMRQGNYEAAAERLRAGLAALDQATPVRTDFDSLGMFEHWIRFLPAKNY